MAGVASEGWWGGPGPVGSSLARSGRCSTIEETFLFGTAFTVRLSFIANLILYQCTRVVQNDIKWVQDGQT